MICSYIRNMIDWTFAQILYYGTTSSFRKLYEQGFLQDLIIEPGYTMNVWIMYKFYQPFSAN